MEERESWLELWDRKRLEANTPGPDGLPRLASWSPEEIALRDGATPITERVDVAVQRFDGGELVIDSVAFMQTYGVFDEQEFPAAMSPEQLKAWDNLADEEGE